MKVNIITHNETEKINDLIDFMIKSDSLFNSSPQSKNAHLAILNNFFDEKTSFFILSDKSEYDACASLTFHNEYPNIAFIGNYHLPVNNPNRNAIRRELFSSLVKHAKRKGVKTLVGPINFNTWLSNRFKYPADTTLLNWEPSNPREYAEDFLAENMIVDKKYFSYFLPSIEDISVLKPIADNVLSQGFKLIPINKDNLETQKILYQLNCECFSENYFYTKISFEQYKATHLASLTGIDLSYSAFIKNDERIWGYVFNIPIGDEIIVKTVLVSPLCRSSGIGTTLLYETLLIAKNDGFRKIVGALIREGNISAIIFKKSVTPLTQTSEYLLFKKDIS
jgi:GNAT superfamily N-acetyltransferase